MKTAQSYEVGSRRRAIADFIAMGHSRREAFNHFVDYVRNQIALFVFKRNRTAAEKQQGFYHRTPKPMGEQIVELWNEVGRVYAEMHGQSVPTKAPKVSQELIDAAASGDSAAIGNLTEAVADAGESDSAIGNAPVPTMPEADNPIVPTEIEEALAELDAMNDEDDAIVNEPIADETVNHPTAKGKESVKSQLDYFRAKYRECKAL